MNKYIVVTEKSQEVVCADDVQLNEDGTLLFYRYYDEEGNLTTSRVAAFKVYEYFLLDEEDSISTSESANQAPKSDVQLELQRAKENGVR